MNKQTVVIAGQGREQASALLSKLLPSEIQIFTTSGEAPEFRDTRCAMALILPVPTGSGRALRRSLRALTHRKGLIVAYGRDPSIRLGCKGFAYRFRWFDETRPWPGVASGELAIIGALRIAHELGVDQETIKRVLR